MTLTHFIKKTSAGMLALSLAVMPLMTSCLSKVQAEIDELQERVEALEARFQDEVSALKKLIEESVTVVSCKFSLADNCWKLVLSDGSSVDIYDKVKLPDLIVTYITDEGGVKYWAVADANGNVTAITDASGKMIPIVPDSPEPAVRVTEDGYYEISFDGGKTWTRTGTSDTSLFVGCNPVYPEDGSTPYVEITLATGEVIKVLMKSEGENLIAFYDYINGTEIKEAYVAYGDTFSVSPVLSSTVTDLLITVPAGWKVKDVWYEDYVEIKFTAPSLEAVKAGFAESEGSAKVLAVAGNDRVETATIFLSTSPADYIIANNDVTIEPRYGLTYGFFYGVCKVSDFDAEAFADFLASPDFASQAPFLHSYDSIHSSLPALCGQELENGVKYYFWIAPGLERNGDLYVDPDTFITEEVYEKVVSLEIVGESTFNDANVLMKLLGSDYYYGGVSRKALFNAETVVNSLYDMIEAPESGVYEGPVSLFATHGVMRELLADTEYVVWMVAAEEGKTNYIPEEVVTAEFKTKPMQTTGGTASVIAASEEITMTSISVTLNAEGAEYIYYLFVQDSQLTGYPTDASKVNYLLKNGKKIRNSSTVASVTGLTSGTSRHLWAMAVDAEGRIGGVFQNSYKSNSVVYSDAIDFYVNEPATTIGQTSADIKINVIKGSPVKYRYACLDASGSQWASTYKGILANLQEDMIANQYKFKDVEANSEGIIHIEGLKIDVDYVFAVMAFDSEGLPTKAQKFTFRTHMDLGNFVYKTVNGEENPVWAASRPTVTLYPNEYDMVGDFGIIVYKIDVPEGMTAYVACYHPDYFTYEKISTPEEYTVAIYQEQNVVKSGVKTSFYGASTGYCIYVTWCDADGNFYEPYVVESGFKGGWGM